MSTAHMSRAEATRRRLVAIRFAVLGIALALTIAGVMLLTPFATAGIVVQILISVPLVASLYVLSESRPLTLLMFGAIAVLSVLAVLFANRGDAWLLIVDTGLRALVLAGVTWWIAVEVVREARISLDTILGGICIYLLLGFFYAHVYVMLELADPRALLSGGQPLADLSSEHPLKGVAAIVYYGYATLTTVAYGDIVPVTPLARFVAITEAMVGQLFPTIFIARLVSLNVAQMGSTGDS
jgi:ion channel